MGQEKTSVLFGDVGMGAATAMTKIRYLNSKVSIFIVRVSRDLYREMAFALSCLTQLKGSSVTVRCLRICSTSRTSLEAMKSMIAMESIDEEELLQALM